MEVKRGEVYFATLGDSACNIGSEQEGYRPVLIVQNDIGNKYSPTVIVCCMTSKIYKTQIPTHVRLNAFDYGLTEDSLILCEQIKTIDKMRLRNKLTELNKNDLQRVNTAIKLSLNIV
ncbi:MAG: type II toxin-antitoxin system PemK/MazF family toxin [Christensenellaceae bacterium]|jgi:mRNA interferase MazF|nr:type II toxin-antitoxin system PemK/MazF family toxin [Christensenellaceae bacterium]